MYSFGLVKRRRRRKIAAIFAIVGAIGTTVLGIVAFLGRQVGTFTINLKNDGVALSMDTHKTFDNPTSYLSAAGFDKISGPYNYSWFVTPDPETHIRLRDRLHSEDTDYTLGRDSNENGIRFFKYTFYIKNTGALHAGFDMNINLNENLAPKNGAQPLDQYLRIMVFEDDNDPVIYAHYSLTLDPGPDFDYREYVTKGPEAEQDGNYFGKAELFRSETVLVSLRNTLEPDQIRMYTLVFWLEGDDPECNLIPDEASLRIGATINGYPQSKKVD